jgi:zinc transport system substrate-binding protein
MSPKHFGLAMTLVFGLAPSVFVQAQAPSGPDRVRIMATVFPLREFAEAVGGDRAEVDLLIPPGAEVHSWQPRAGDIRKISSGLDVFLYVGRALEPWAEDILKSVSRPRLRVLETSRGMDLIEEEEGPGEAGHGLDPHVWLDFGQDLAILDRIAAALSEVRPEWGPFFRANAEDYKAKLRGLDARYAASLRACRGRRILLAGHAAFGYLAKRYGLVQTAVYGASPDAAPAPREMVRLIAAAKDEGIRTVFYEPSVGDRLARVVAGEIGADVRLLYPGHALPRAKAERAMTFLDMMERNLEALVHGLGCL